MSALDESIRALVINLLEDLREQFKLSYVFIAHDLSVVEHISHRVVVVGQRQLVDRSSASVTANVGNDRSDATATPSRGAG